MLTRRHIRLKVMQNIYALKISDFQYTKETEKNLLESIDSIYELYLILLLLLVELLKKAETKFSISKNKLLLDRNNIFDNQKMIKNKFLNNLRSDELLIEEINKRNLAVWDLDFKYVDLIYDQLIKSELYSNYINDNKISFNNDKDFISRLFKEIIVKDEKLYNYLEDKNINWIDDLPLVNTFMLKLINKSKETSSKRYFLPKLYKDVEDKVFAKKLFKTTLKNYKNYNAEISKKT